MVYSEAMLEIDALELLGELDWKPVEGRKLAPGSRERENWHDIVLRGRLLNALQNLNPGAVSYTHLTLPTIAAECRSRWSPYH